jgi:hypothetical protein
VKLIVAQLIKNTLLLWNLKLLCCVYKSATGPYPEPDVSNPEAPTHKKDRGWIKELLFGI